MRADSIEAPVTKEQWNYIHEMGGALRSSLDNVTAVFAPSCIGHAVLTKREWMNVKIDDISLAEALRCWERSTGKRNKSRRAFDGKKNRQNHNHNNRNDRNNHTDIEINNQFVEADQQQKQRGRSESKTYKTVMLRHERHRLSKEERQRRQQNMTKEERQKRRQNRIKRKQKNSSQKNDKFNIPLDERTLNGFPNNNKSKNNNKNNNSNNKNNKNHNNGQHRQNNDENKQRKKRRNNHKNHDNRRVPHHRRKSAEPERCSLRLLERCSWPQCNHSCPALTNPLTGEEVRFLELLSSFGLDIEAVATALGIDMQTLHNMDQTELVNLLTQQVSK